MEACITRQAFHLLLALDSARARQTSTHTEATAEAEVGGELSAALDRPHPARSPHPPRRGGTGPDGPPPHRWPLRVPLQGTPSPLPPYPPAHAEARYIAGCSGPEQFRLDMQMSFRPCADHNHHNGWNWRIG
eukprot:2649875-Prymnesium_polylepis.1